MKPRLQTWMAWNASCVYQPSSLFSPDCEPHRRDGTLPHHKHHVWLRPLFLGQKYSAKTPELPGNLWTVLRLWAAGCWISCLHTDFFFLNTNFWCNAKIPRCGWVQLLCVQPASWTRPLWIKRWPHTTDTRSRCLGYEPCRSGDHPGSLEYIIWYIGKKWGVINECAYCYHVCLLIGCSLWQMHGQHCLTTL